MKSSITKQVFTAEFRAEAVKLVAEQGLSISEVARRLDMSPKTLSRWIILAKEGNLAKVNAKRIVPVSEMEAEGFRRINFLKAKSVMLSTFLKLMLSHA